MARWARWARDQLLAARVDGRAVAPFRYRDRGALVSLGSRCGTAGLGDSALAGGLGTTLYGLLARLAYGARQQRHLALLHGPLRAALTLAGDWLAAHGAPQVKPK